jgi:hypothetical protein
LSDWIGTGTVIVPEDETTPPGASPYFAFSTDFLSTYQKNAYAESVRMFGFDVVYVPVEFVEGDVDYVFGEITKIKYTIAYDVRMRVEGYDDLHRALMSYSKFGFFIQPENVEVSVGKTDFRTAVPLAGTPKAGDLILVKIHDEDVLFEVTAAALKYDSFYLFSVRLYNYSNPTTISTGVTELDRVATDRDQVATLPAGETVNAAVQRVAEESEDFSRPDGIWGRY